MCGGDNGQQKIGESGFAISFSNLEQQQTKHKTTYKTPRMLAQQQTRPKPPKDKNLFDLLTEEARKKAVQISNKGGLLSQITDGINAGVLGSKVIIGLAQTLAEQSELYHTEDEMLGIGDAANPDKEITKRNFGKHKQLPYANIYVREREFTQLVKGTKEVSSSDRKEVMGVLNKLKDCYHFLSVKDAQGNEKYVGMQLLNISGIVIDPKTNARGYIVELKPIFIHGIKNDFVTLRKDTLQKLGGRTSDLTMKLFWFLTEQHSYKTREGYPLVRIFKDELLNHIAILKMYEKNIKRRNEDFAKAIEKMAEVGLIKPLKGKNGTLLPEEKRGYREELAQDGMSKICLFFLNKDYTQETYTIPTEEQYNEALELLPPEPEESTDGEMEFF